MDTFNLKKVKEVKHLDDNIVINRVWESN